MALGLVFAMGPAFTTGTEPTVVNGHLIPLPFAVLDFLPGLSRFWWPYRFLVLVGVGSAACMAILMSRLPSARRKQLAIGMACLLLIEGRFTLMKATRAGDPTIPSSVWDPEPMGNFYAFELPEWMADPPQEGGILEFPMGEIANTAPLWAPYHQLPTAHGDGVREIHIRPPDFESNVRNNRMFSSWAQNLMPDVDSESLEELYTLGFRFVLVHQDRETDPANNNRLGQILGRLETGIGSPIHREDALTVFAIPSPRLD